jgi:hypothetical protein
MRLRIGFSFAAGPVVAPGLFAGGGFAFRMGIQKSALLAAYVQVMPMGFAKVGRAGGESRRGIVALVPTSFMGALTPWDWLEVAAGPSIDYAGAQVAFYPRGTKESAHAVLFGVAGRVAFHIGSRDPETGDRASLTFGLNPHVTFLEDGSPFVLVTAGFGADWY